MSKTTSTGPKPSETSTPWIDLKKIKTNSQNPRQPVPLLAKMGHGVFEKLEGSDRTPLMELALSDNPEHRAEFCELIEKHENTNGNEPVSHDENEECKAGIVGLAADLLTHGWIHAGMVRKSPDGTMDLIVGARRCIAAAYNYAKSGGTVPCRGQFKVVEMSDTEAKFTALAENIHRRDMNPMEQARVFGTLKKAGATTKEIEQQSGVDHQTVRNRLGLLKLEPKEQILVENGTLPMVKALKMLAARKSNSNGNPTVPTNQNRPGGRSQAPTVSDWKVIYQSGKIDNKEVHEEVRKFAAVHVLKVDYETLTALKHRLAKEEKEAEAETKRIKDEKDAVKAKKELEKVEAKAEKEAKKVADLKAEADAKAKAVAAK